MYAWAYLVSTNTIIAIIIIWNLFVFENLGGKNLCRGPH